MRRLLPDPGDEPLDELYRDLSFPAPPDDRPYVYIGMVASVDGTVTVDGRSGPLGGRADLTAFRSLRASADAVLAGAGTVRTEDYRGVRLPDDVRRSRTDDGRDELPPIVVPTASVALDPEARLFTDTGRAPWLVVPADTPSSRLDPLRDRAEVVRAGTGRVDLRVALLRLRERGVRRLLVEGGPRLNAQLVGAGLVDELFLTVAPVLVGGGPGPLATSLPGPVRVSPLGVREHGGELLLRYRVGSPEDA